MTNVVPLLTKQCTKCLREFPLADFYARKGRTSKSKIYAQCRECVIAREQERYKDPERRRQIKINTRRTHAWRQGVAVWDIERWYDEQLAKQGGKCAMPDCRLPAEENHHRRLAIDHSKASGKFRALLCNRCNLQLGHYQNRDAAFKAYLKKYGR